jgi:hypothetical protein
LQDLDQAIIHIESVLESEPGEIRYWHALGLFLTTTEQWKVAIGALEQGASLCEVDLSEKAVGDGVDDRLQTNVKEMNKIHIKDFGETGCGDSTAHPDTPEPGKNPPKSKVLLDLQADAIAPSETLLRHLPDHPPPSRQEVFEHALQLRMTQAAVSEHVEGPEGAGAR